MATLIYSDLNIEIEDLETDTVTLNPSEKRKLRRSVLGRFFNWTFCTESIFGAQLLSGQEWMLLFTTPPGWIIAGSSLLTGVIGGGFRYVSFKKTLLTERKEKIQGYLVTLEEQYKKKPNASLADLWQRTQQIDDLAIRAKLQICILECQPAQEEKESKNTEQKSVVSTAPLVVTPEQISVKIDAAITQQTSKKPQIELQQIPKPRFASYQALCNGKLTPEDESSMQRTATGTFFNTLINLLGVVGTTYIGLTVKGIAAFALLGIGPVGWAIIGSTFLLSLGVAIYKYRSSSRRKYLVVDVAQGSAAKQLEFNELEFQRYRELFTDSTLKIKLNKIWKEISKRFSPNAGQQAAKANIQADFLADLKLLKNNSKTREKILTKWDGIDLKLREHGIGSLEIQANDSRPPEVLPTASPKGMLDSVLGCFPNLFAKKCKRSSYPDVFNGFSRPTLATKKCTGNITQQPSQSISPPVLAQ